MIRWENLLLIPPIEIWLSELSGIVNSVIIFDASPWIFLEPKFSVREERLYLDSINCEGQFQGVQDFVSQNRGLPILCDWVNGEYCLPYGEFIAVGECVGVYQSGHHEYYRVVTINHGKVSGFSDFHFTKLPYE